MSMAANDISHDNLALIGDRVAAGLGALDSERVIARLLEHDHTLWSDDPAEITQPNRLGWLEVHREMHGATAGLRDFATSVAGAGYRTAVVMGMGGSSLAPEVFQETFGAAQGMLTLHILDTTNPDDVASLTNRLDLERTLFIVSSKSGSTIETMSQFAYFWGLLPDGAHYVAITDEGSALHKLGEEHNFRRVFLSNPNIGGRYSALSYFGLVPAAVAGVDVDLLLATADEMAQAGLDTHSANNPGAYRSEERREGKEGPSK
jgi:glucose-6-phosphate isomerase